jgi:hypothetical protein
MKNAFLLIVLIIGLGQLNAQITMERSDYTAEVGDAIIFRYVESNAVSLPQEGENQVWDYTSLQLLGSDTITLDLYDGTTFPEANILQEEVALEPVGPFFVEFDLTIYETLDDTGYGRTGVKTDPALVPVEAVTGSSSDSLNFLESYATYSDGPDYYAKFPMSYDDSWEGSYVTIDEFLFTFAAFGLDHSPGYIQTTGDVIHEVIGHGTIALPNPVDQMTVSLEALLVKTTTAEQDSFFLLGAPMPEMLVVGFGQAQGQQRFTESYSFYAKGFPAPVLTFENDTLVRMLADLDAVTSIAEVENQSIPFQYYPNPASDQLQVQFEKSTNEPWMFSLYNSLGQEVLTQAMTHPKGAVSESIEFPQQLSAGIYFYALKSGDQKLRSSGSLQVK